MKSACCHFPKKSLGSSIKDDADEMVWHRKGVQLAENLHQCLQRLYFRPGEGSVSYQVPAVENHSSASSTLMYMDQRESPFCC